MKVIFLGLIILASMNTWAMNLTKKLQVTKLRFDETKKVYDVTFEIRAGVYHTNKDHVGCLQKSIEKKIPVTVEFEAMGLKIIKCSL
jgi:hypothetical protein